jgi:hypothetical protein
VLVPGGRVVVATFAHAHFDTWWAGRFFPSIPRLDRERFPADDALERELADAGFGGIVSERLSAVQAIGRDEALARIRGRNISTYELLSPEELRDGTRRAEAELPETVEVRLEQLVVAAVYAPGT